MKTQYRIPPYLGLNKLTKNKAHYQVELGFSKRLQKKLQVDKSALSALMGAKEFSPEIEKELVNAKILKEDFRSQTPATLKRYDRHLLFYQSYDLDPIATQKLLSQKTVALIGMGGIGNWVGLNLIGAGFKELRLIDFDTIELSNLTRQVLFDEGAIGKSKVRVAQKVLRPKNSQTKISIFDQKVEGVPSLRAALKGVDFIVISADRPAQIHDWINELAVELQIPYLNIGYRDTEGVVGPLTVPGKTSCYQCFKHHSSGTSEVNSSRDAWKVRYQAPSFGPLNACISSLGSLEVIKYFTQFGCCESLDTELCFDPVTFSINRSTYHRDSDCLECGEI